MPGHICTQESILKSMNSYRPRESPSILIINTIKRNYLWMGISTCIAMCTRILMIIDMYPVDIPIHTAIHLLANYCGLEVSAYGLIIIYTYG